MKCKLNQNIILIQCNVIGYDDWKWQNIAPGGFWFEITACELFAGLVDGEH